MTDLRQHGFAEPTESEDVLSLGALFRIFQKRLWVMVLVVTSLTGTVVGFTLAETPQYEASIKILVGQENGISATAQEGPALQAMTLTMAEAVNSRRVADAVIQELNLPITPESFLGSLSVEPITDTQFIRVSYVDTDPQRAERVVETVGSVFSDQISKLSTQDSANDSAITVTVWERAVAPSAPISPNPVRSGFLALVLGGMLAIGLALLLEYLDDRWHSSEEAEAISGVPTLGSIPEFDVSWNKRKKYRNR
jgi:capsular polysaccharide biosynthesis protein